MVQSGGEEDGVLVKPVIICLIAFERLRFNRYSISAGLAPKPVRVNRWRASAKDNLEPCVLVSPKANAGLVNASVYIAETIKIANRNVCFMLQGKLVRWLHSFNIDKIGNNTSKFS